MDKQHVRTVIDNARKSSRWSAWATPFGRREIAKMQPEDIHANFGLPAARLVACIRAKMIVGGAIK